MNFLNFSIIMSAIGAFFYGLMAAFSPCVFPFYPICFTYLSSNAHKKNENGKIYYDRKKIINNVIFFVIGITLAYIIIISLAFSLNNFFSKYKIIIELFFGIFLIFLGLFQLDIIQVKKLNATYKKELDVDKMNFFKAFFLGFSSALSWSPCLGPYLVSTVALLITEFSFFSGSILMIIYTLGFSLPFLLLGIFSMEAINFLNKFKNVVKYTTRIGAAIIIFMGVYMLFNTYRDINYKLENLQQNSISYEQNYLASYISETPIKDQFGNTHSLSEHKGKIIVLNFWTTWCVYCLEEIPDIIKIFEERGYNKEDVIILGVGNPSTENYRNADVPEKELSDFISRQNISYPILFDTESVLFNSFNIIAFPTTIFIDKKGNIANNIIGGTNKEQIDSVINSLR